MARVNTEARSKLALLFEQRNFARTGNDAVVFMVLMGSHAAAPARVTGITTGAGGQTRPDRWDGGGSVTDILMPPAR
jgi:hypothetical protein